MLDKRLNLLAYLTYKAAERRGKITLDYDKGVADILEEVTEAIREDRPYYIKDGKPEGYLVELADVIIATLTLMHTHREDAGKTVGEIILEKMEYNSTRED